MISKAIGGYFELELPFCDEYHKKALRLNSGKNCLEYILRARKYKKVFIPYYTCEVVLYPFEKLEVAYVFYHINEKLEIQEDIILHDGEALLYTNYFGLKQIYVEQLAVKYGDQLIVDCTQAFYARPLENIDTFYTCRKFFGVSDGAYLYSNERADIQIEQSTSYERVAHLVKRIDVSPEFGFNDFHVSDNTLADEDIKMMSRFTQRVMQSIDYEKAGTKRRDNYNYLHMFLGENNLFTLALDDDAVPMVYPFFSNDEDLRSKLIDNKIFIARYWPNVLEWCLQKDWEYQLAKNLVCLPIDQRYNEDDMIYMLNLLNIYLKKQ